MQNYTELTARTEYKQSRNGKTITLFYKTLDNQNIYTACMYSCLQRICNKETEHYEVTIIRQHLLASEN